MAISYLFPNKEYPNYGIFVLNRLSALRKYCEIKVINPIPWFPFHSRFRRYKWYNKIPLKETIRNIEVFHPRFPILPRIFKMLDCITYSLVVIPMALHLRKLYPFDLIDLHWTYPDLPSGYILSKCSNRKFITTVRGKEALYLDEFGIRKRITINMLKKSSFIISLSEELRDICVKSGCPETRTVTIRNGVDTKKFFVTEKRVSRKTLQIPLEEYVILSIGSLVYGKGFDRIIRAIPILLKKRSNVKLYIIGSEGAAGFYKKKLQVIVSQLGLEKYIRFVGEVSNRELLYWYNSADIFCLASRSEGCPNVLLEALSCGCPSLATDVGSVREIMTKEFMGEVVSNRDDAIIDGLASMLNRKFDRQLIADYMKKYDWDWCARQVYEIYRSILRKSE